MVCDTSVALCELHRLFRFGLAHRHGLAGRDWDCVYVDSMAGRHIVNHTRGRMQCTDANPTAVIDALSEAVPVIEIQIVGVNLLDKDGKWAWQAYPDTFYTDRSKVDLYSVKVAWAIHANRHVGRKGNDKRLEHRAAEASGGR